MSRTDEFLLRLIGLKADAEGRGLWRVRALLEEAQAAFLDGSDALGNDRRSRRGTKAPADPDGDAAP